jgi:hypothetical protein
MPARGNADRLVEARWKEFGEWRRRLQPTWLLADDLSVDGSARLRLRPRRGDPRDGGRTAGVGLGYVGAGALAHFETRARGARLLRQEFQITLQQHRHLPVANHIHIGAGRVEQDVLLSVAQALIGGEHPRFSGSDIVFGLETVEQQLVDLDAERSGGEPGARLRGVVDVRYAVYRWTIAGFGDGDALVGHPDAGTGRIQLRIELVGLGERAEDGFGGCGQWRKRGR